ncbi:MAG: hypothetical protein WA755_07015 [Candidatus Acidiferrales bacterium]
MAQWHLKPSDLKKYPHFDPLISARTAESYSTDKIRVARHAFYPLMRYDQRWTRFAERGALGRIKERPIRYAARLDSCIFSYYRHVLSERYEAELVRLGLDRSVLAYRRIPTDDGRGGKCNIHFARDAILKIRELGDCCVIGLDISGFFESLDHARLKDLWCRVLEVGKLPTDHFRVYKAITEYAEVEKVKVYERLGHFGEKQAGWDGKPTTGYLTPFRKIPKHLCGGKEFREKIAGRGCSTSIIETNYKPYGIPQGAPISDLLANLYLLDFDNTVGMWIREVGGAYYRYSDDILIAVPGDESVGRDLRQRTCGLVREFGPRLVIKPEKSSLFVFRRCGAEQTFQLLDGTRGKNGLEYLGFRYDGKRVYLRDATISNLRRKVAHAARREASSCARRYPDKDVLKLKSLFNYERLIKRFGRVEDFDGKERNYRNWTFWTYATRASEVFGGLGRTILRQLRNHRKSIRWRAEKELERAVARRDRLKGHQSGLARFG